MSDSIATNQAAPATPPRPARARRRIAVALLLLVTAAAFFVPALNWFFSQRQSGIRAVTHAHLRSFELGAEVYQNDHGVLPTLDQLLAANVVPTESLALFSRATPLPGESLGPEFPLIVQTKPCRAVKKGESWGGPGEFIDRDLPACRFLLRADWTIVEMSEPDYQRDFASRITLAPIK